MPTDMPCILLKIRNLPEVSWPELSAFGTEVCGNATARSNSMSTTSCSPVRSVPDRRRNMGRLLSCNQAAGWKEGRILPGLIGKSGARLVQGVICRVLSRLFSRVIVSSPCLPWLTLPTHILWHHSGRKSVKNDFPLSLPFARTRHRMTPSGGVTHFAMIWVTLTALLIWCSFIAVRDGGDE